MIVWLLVVASSNISAATHKYSLILAEFGTDSDGEQTQTLVRYRFTDGVLTAKENVLTTRTFQLRYDLGGNQIYQNRYVITMWGDVIDLATGQILFKSKGQLVAIDRDSNSVIVRVERVDKHAIHAFNLTSRQDRVIEQPGFAAMTGVVSPNGQAIVSGNNAEIWLQNLSGDKVLLGSDFQRSGTFECSDYQIPTFLWLDNKHLLTQRENGKLFVVDITGHMEPLVIIPGIDPFPCGPELRRDEENQIYYKGGMKAWRIDIGNRTFEPYLWEPHGNGFEVEYERNDAYGRTIRYRGREIGRWWCSGWSALTAPGHIAVDFGPVGSNLGYPEGVKVWSAETGAWTTIKPDWLVRIIGWIEE